MLVPLNIDSLVSQLSPYMAEALPDIATNLASTGVEAAAAATVGGLRSIGKSISRRFRQSRASSHARAEFERNWAEALTPSQREKAIRDLLNEDPSFAALLDMLLLRRDFVAAVASYCNRLPALDEDLLLSDVYVPLSIRSMAGTLSASETSGQSEITSAGNHIIEGGAGSGKSTFLRYLARAEAQGLLRDKHDVAFDELRLPCLIRAEDLVVSDDLATTLHRVMTTSLAGLLTQPLPSDFFVTSAVNGHRNWLIFVDGVDEVEGRRRREVWDIIRLHAERDNAFRFIITTRSEAMPSTSIGEVISHWKMDPIDASGQVVFASNYISSEDSRNKFSKILEQREFRYVAQNPLFLAMSAQIFSRTGEMHKRKIDLYEHYLAFVLSKVAGSDMARISNLNQLLCLVARGLDTPKELVRQHASFVRALTASFSILEAEEALGRLLERTGLIRRNANKLRFSHDSFRSYFRAIYLAKQSAPGAEILKEIDPFREGWAVVEHVMLRWGRDGRDIGPVLQSLLEFGDQGHQCAAAVIASSDGGHDSVACSIAERLLRDAREMGPTVADTESLVILAENSSAVYELLVEELGSTTFVSDTFIAECLLDAGHTSEALDELSWIAENRKGYSPDRVVAAELLLKHGYRDGALVALRDVALNGDEYWAMAKAASILYEHARTLENRQILANLCVAEDKEPSDTISTSTLSRLMELGEVELALPHLEAATRLSSKNVHDFFSRQEAIEAAKSIALYHNRAAGKQILEQMLEVANTIREKGEIASALADLGFEQEARSAIRCSLQVDGFEVDWLVADLLVRLGLGDEARSAVEAAVSHLLGKDPRVYEAVTLIEYALPILNKEPMAALVHSRARSLKEPGLARGLALLGEPDDARALLSAFIRDGNIDLRIRAAGELCELGDARFGRKQLRIITRDRRVDAHARILAAETLKRVGFLRDAAFGFARVVKDPSISVKQRANLAVAFDELEHDRNDIVWVPLMSILQDRTQPIIDRIEAAEALVHIDGDDGYSDLVYVELFDMLDDGDLSDRDVLCVGASLGQSGWTLDRMPGVRRVLTSATVDPSHKIPTLHALDRYDRDTEAASLLLKIAEHPDASVELALEAIGAIWRSSQNSEAQAFLSQIAGDTTIPPNWRLKAAKHQASELQQAALISLAKDPSIGVETRIAALEALPKNNTTDRVELLKNIADLVDLTFWDRKEIAEAAHRLEAPELVTSMLRSAMNDRPLSVMEMVELAKFCRQLDYDSDADQMLLELLALPQVIIESTEDYDIAIEGIELAAELARERAIDRLEELLNSDAIGWWELSAVLEAMVGFIGKEAARGKAHSIISKLYIALQTTERAEFAEWLYQAKALLKLGLFEDYQALLAFAENKENMISHRAEVCVSVMQYASEGSLAYRTARDLLAKLDKNEMSLKDRIAIVRALRYASCSLETNEWLDLCVANPPEGSEDRRELASLLHASGRVAEAKGLIEGMDASVLVNGSIFPLEKDLIDSVLDEDRVAETKFSQMMSNDDPIEQLWCAKEYAEERGDRKVLKLIFDAANGSGDDPSAQLEAIDCLDQLGFRDLSRQLFAAMPGHDIEPYWLGAQLLKFGRKAEAVPFYVKAARSNIEYNEGLIWGGLADLGLELELKESRFRHSLCTD